MPKKHREFLKSFDRYAQVVSLTYKDSGRFETASGGCATIIFFLILAYWIATNSFYAFYGNGSFTTD